MKHSSLKTVVSQTQRRRNLTHSRRPSSRTYGTFTRTERTRKGTKQRGRPISAQEPSQTLTRQIRQFLKNSYYSNTTLYYKTLLQYYLVLQNTTPVLTCTTKYYSNTTLYYEELLQYYSLLQRLLCTTPVLPYTTKYHSSTTLYYASTTLYYKVLPRPTKCFMIDPHHI